jgi:NHLM bacteriocin system ABC transporter ATP-binding protein
LKLASLSLQPEQYGTVHHPASNVPFFVQDTSKVWVVQKGKLDLFLSSVKGGDLTGARHHVMRVEENRAVFGAGSHFEDVALVASPAPGTVLLCIALSDLCLMARAGDEVSVALLDQWINDLSAAASKSSVAEGFVPLEVNDTVNIPEGPRTVVPRQGVLWVNHRKGHSHFLAAEKLPAINGHGFFPVSRYGWIEAAQGSEVYSVDSLAVAKIDQEWQGLQNFHAIIMSCLVAERERALESEQKRAHRRASSDSSLLHTALLRLAAPMQKVHALANGEESCSDPVFLACDVIGKKLGIKIKPHPDMLRGLKVVDPVMQVARASSIRVRKIALRGQWWRKDNGPLLVFSEKENKPLAVLPRSARHNEIYDPGNHSVSVVTYEMATELNPMGYVLYRPFPAKKLSAWDLLKFGMRGNRGELTAIILTGLLAGLMGVVTPYATGVIFDRLIPGAERTQLIAMSAFLMAIALATAMFTFVRGFAVLRLQGKMDASLQAAVWDRLLNLPVSFFRDYTSGDLAQRSMGISQIREMLTGSTLTAILSGIFSIFNFLLLFYYSWQLALIATALVVVASLVTIACGFAQVRQQREISRLQGRISSKLLQFLTGIAKFRISGTEVRAFSAWAREFSQQKEAAIISRRISNRLIVFNSVFPLVCMGIIFYYHGMVILPLSSELTTGKFLAFLASFMQFLVATLTLSSTMVETLSIIPIYERAKPILVALPEVSETKVNPGRLSGAIEISHATFRYRPDNPPVLRDISVRIEPGQFVAFVGPSGSGKSTLLRLLLGFEAPESGAIYYDGQDLAGVDVQAVRHQTGVVLQTSRPVAGSIFDNIVGSAPLTLDDAWEAARLSGIDEDIRRMPMGMHTYLTDGGGGISGGQRQRLMIARAIVARPRILLFDEATSALDNRTQAIVSHSLESLQTTRIVIAHRLSTIMNADRIFVIDRGSVVQSGTYQELLEQPGLFQNLAKRQLA